MSGVRVLGVFKCSGFRFLGGEMSGGQLRTMVKCMEFLYIWGEKVKSNISAKELYRNGGMDLFTFSAV